MPELPEVETIRRGLESLLPDNPRIERIELIRGDLRRPIAAKDLAVLNQQSIVSVRRRAKYLLMDLENHTLLSHLGMTGSWRVAPLGSEKKHDHCYVHLSDGRRLAFHDPRRFGVLEVLKKGTENSHSSFVNLGPEPLDSASFNSQWIMQQTRKKSSVIKVWLMDQRNVVGVGNIYASEALFLAGISPKRKANRIKPDESKKLVKAIVKVLNSAIKSGGTTLKDFRQASGGEGYFQNKLKVYDRSGEPCVICGTSIRRVVMVGRSTYWCPSCQN